MAQISYLEKFYAQQGEGLYTGAASVFLRTFGCNLRCRGFGRNVIPIDEKHNPEVLKIIKNIDEYDTLEDLPLVKTGCDSYAAVYPEFKRFANKADPEQLAHELLALTGQKQWGDIHLVITGGEPLLGWQRVYPQLLDACVKQGLKYVTFETNGTQTLTDSFRQYIAATASTIEYTFSVSPKLPASGERLDAAIKTDAIESYLGAAHNIYFKFVVSEASDVADAKDVLTFYKHKSDAMVQALDAVPVYLMPLGGLEAEYNSNFKTIAQLALDNGMRFSPRLHLSISGNVWGS